MGLAAERRRRVLAPPDFVLRGLGAIDASIAEYEGLAIAGVPCAESALRLALTLVHKNANKSSETIIHLNTGVPAAGLTVAQMIRRLIRMRAQGVGDFPVATLAPRGMGDDVRFIMLHGKPRPDNYAIVYLARDCVAPGHPAEGHYAFMQIDAVKAATYQAPPPDQRVMIFTRMPVEASEQVYWRCQPTPETMELFLDAERRGLACSCCQQIACVHEIAWLLKNPRGKRISLMPNHMLQGLDRAVVGRKNPPAGWQVSVMPDDGISVTQPNGKRSTMPRVHQRPTLVNLPFLLGWFPAGMLSAAEKRYYGVRQGLRWWAEAASCHFKAYLLPSDYYDVVVPPFHITAYAFNRKSLLDRVVGVAEFGSRVLTTAAAVCAGLLASNVWKWTRHEYYKPTLVRLEKQVISTKEAFIETVFNWREPWHVANQDPKTAPLGTIWVVKRWLADGAGALLHAGFPDTPSIQRLRDWFRIFRISAWNRARPRPLRDHGYGLLRGLSESRYEWRLSREGFFEYGDRWWRNARSSLLRCAIVGVAVGVLGWYLLPRFLPLHRYQRVFTAGAEKAFGSTAGLDIQFPRPDELHSRLSLMANPCEADVIDRVRRICNEERWPVRVDRDEMQTWVSRVVTEPGKMLVPRQRPGVCISCQLKKPTYRSECRDCRRSRRLHPPDGINYHDTVAKSIPRLGIWSRRAQFPTTLEIKEGVEVMVGRRHKLDISHPVHFKAWYDKQPAVATCRGWNSGPTFLGHVPECFPKGQATALLAFMIRMGRKRDHSAKRYVYDLAYAYLSDHLEPLEPEGRDQFLSHFSGEKLQKMLEAEELIRQGYAPQPEVRLRCNGFTKAEKSMSTEYCGGTHMDKPVRKPRLICAPPPCVLRLVGPYTHRQTKWLGECFDYTGHVFYAGCATPEQLDHFLNVTRREAEDWYIFVDDITAIDANHSAKSFEFLDRVRKEQFTNMPTIIEQLWDSFACVKVKIGDAVCVADWVNASGVSDTSYKNSLICLITRVLATANMVARLDSLSLDAALALIAAVAEIVYTSASGDDGYTVVPKQLLGVDVTTAEAKRAYESLWADAGFGVKLAIVPPTRWRMATYLAARPTWAGDHYVWTPEPARRLKMSWWQIDSGMHPGAWGRGIATQLAVAGGCNPVIRPIAEWYLKNTSGPIAKVAMSDNPYNPWQNRSTQYSVTERSVHEFCADYGVSLKEYERFLAVLALVEDVYVDFGGHLLERVFAEES